MGNILFVDDDSISLQLMTRAVALLGHEVICDPSPRRALRRVVENPPVLILVDLQMMEMSGIEFIRELRQLDVGRDIPALIYTASIEPYELRQALEAGATGTLLKPIDFDEFKRIIDRYNPPHE